ncbi:hypothetical protein NLM27_41815 [Bradyrhizobium sp. CCGB12]|uniref:hypothetical protein n=1 Tax=Bradyrhizobium sp. CCGB12 TaxID=2949632 RepID=UPI0020B441CE|nr:hypothetical protein [Bradyrhizobium sp. CCGB12]MCP3395272.1 hypothetical protein [Bradyrhizobium sp. CCGB12]
MIFTFASDGFDRSPHCGIPSGVDVRQILASVVNGQASVIIEIKEAARHTSENGPREGAFLQHL